MPPKKRARPAEPAEHRGMGGGRITPQFAQALEERHQQRYFPVSVDNEAAFAKNSGDPNPSHDQWLLYGNNQPLGCYMIESGARQAALEFVLECIKYGAPMPQLLLVHRQKDDTIKSKLHCKASFSLDWE